MAHVATRKTSRSAAVLGVILAATASASPALAQGQDDVVVMRRTLAPPKFNPPVQTPTPTPTGTPGGSAARWVVGDPVAQPACSAQAPTLAPVSCRDGSGNEVDEARCTDARPDGRGVAPNYAACAYEWKTQPWSAWSSHCSKTATRTRVVECLRQDEDQTPVDASNCDANTPDVQTSEGPTEVVTGCTYTPAYSGTYGACVNGEQSAPIVSCTRSDGTPAALADCGAARQVTTRSCTVRYASCGTLVQGQYSNSTNPFIIITKTGITSIQAAKEACEAEKPSTNYRTARCAWRQSEGILKIITVTGAGKSDAYVGYTETSNGTFFPASNFWSSACTTP